MANRNYKVGQNRFQTMLLPPSIDEYVSEHNPVRAIDAYVSTLDLVNLDIHHASSGLTAGQPAYPPGLLIKLYLYGYINGLRSSRKLEREAARNLEVIWLADTLRPSYKTIANFRKDNSAALKAINKDFILLCKQLNLFAGDEVAVDGSFFKADASAVGRISLRHPSNTVVHGVLLMHALSRYKNGLTLKSIGMVMVFTQVFASKIIPSRYRWLVYNDHSNVAENGRGRCYNGVENWIIRGMSETIELDHSVAARFSRRGYSKPSIFFTG